MEDLALQNDHFHPGEPPPLEKNWLHSLNSTLINNFLILIFLMTEGESVGSISSVDRHPDEVFPHEITCLFTSLSNQMSNTLQSYGHVLLLYTDSCLLLLSYDQCWSHMQVLSSCIKY